MRTWVLVAGVIALAALGACRREHPGPPRTVTAAAMAQATAAAMPTNTPPPTVIAAGTGRRAKIAGGNLGVAATGVIAGIQMWSRAGGILAGGATMVGTVQDGVTVDLIGEQEHLGQKYFQIRDGDTVGWVDSRFVQPQ